MCIVEPKGESYSLIGKRRFEMFLYEYQDIVQCFDDAGFKIVENVQKTYHGNEDKAFVDSYGWYLNLVQKI